MKVHVRKEVQFSEGNRFLLPTSGTCHTLVTRANSSSILPEKY